MLHNSSQTGRESLQVTGATLSFVRTLTAQSHSVTPDCFSLFSSWEAGYFMRLVQEWCLAQWIQSTFIPKWVEILRWSSHSETQLTDKSLWTSSWRNGSCRGAVSVSYYTESPLISWVMCVLSPWSNFFGGVAAKKYGDVNFWGRFILWQGQIWKISISSPSFVVKANRNTLFRPLR